MDKKFWFGLGLAALAGVVGVKLVAEPLGAYLQKSTNATVAKLGSTIA
jgi:hypothetical protein